MFAFDAHQTPNEDMEKFILCPATGLHRNGKAPLGKELHLNLLKNRYLAPTRFDPSITITQLLKPGDDRHRWDQSKSTGATITGYVALIIPNVLGEDCNCYKQDDAHTDTHIDLVASESDVNNFKKHLIIEITPRMKYLAKKCGEDWSTIGLSKQFYHRWVNVEGWLLWDYAHEKQARNTNPKHLDKVWRATCWEIHPVTSIKLSSAGAPELRRSQSTRS